MSTDILDIHLANLDGAIFFRIFVVYGIFIRFDNFLTIIISYYFSSTVSNNNIPSFLRLWRSILNCFSNITMLIPIVSYILNAWRSRIAVVLVGVVEAVDGSVAQLRERDAPSVDAAQLSARARRRVRRRHPASTRRGRVILVQGSAVRFRRVWWILLGCRFLQSERWAYVESGGKRLVRAGKTMKTALEPSDESCSNYEV